MLVLLPSFYQTLNAQIQTSIQGYNVDTDNNGAGLIVHPNNYANDAIRFGSAYASKTGISSKHGNWVNPSGYTNPNNNLNGMDFFVGPSTFTFEQPRLSIWQNGRIGIGTGWGTPAINAKVNLQNNGRLTDTENTGFDIALYVEHMTNCENTLKIGIKNELKGTTPTGCGSQAIGIDNSVLSTCGIGTRYGIKNFVNPTSTATAPNYGIWNVMETTASDAATKYGFYNTMKADASNDKNIYGIYNDLSQSASGLRTRFGIVNLMNTSTLPVSTAAGFYNRVGMLTVADGAKDVALYANADGTNGVAVYGKAANTTSGWAIYANGRAFCTTTWASSDKKLKQGIKPLSNMLEKIMLLAPSNYVFRAEEFKNMALPVEKQYGLIAQELEKVFPEMVTTVQNGVKGPKGEDDFSFKAVNYTSLIPVVIAGIQEQQKTIETQKELIESLEERINRLETAIDKFLGQDTKTLKGSFKLEQNAPNPFSDKTRIAYELPQNIGKAQIIITDLSGKQVKTIPLNDCCGEVEVSAHELSDGTFIYSLVANGKVLKTNKMVIVRN